MFEVLANEEIAPQLHRMVVSAARIARARRPGQFVIVRVGEGGERIPLTIADDDAEAGTITLIIQAVGHSTRDIVAVPVGGSIRDIAGPLGQPTEIERWGKVVCVGGGAGTAVLFPLAKALAHAGNELTTIIGGRSAPYVVLRDELAEFSHEVLCTTEDGSLGEKGFVTQPLKRILEGEHGDRPAAVYAIGPVPMMKAIAELTRKYGVHTVVSLNPLMVDGTGMCGGCRVTVGGETRFACVDGPEFDGHLVDFDELAGRQSAYMELDTHGCRIVPKIKEAELGHKVLSAKERLAIARVKMPEQDSERRTANFDEVNLGLTPELAILEAQRCLQCKNRPCVDGCPVAVRIPDFLDCVAQDDFAGAARILLADNALPATTGRVCPQETQCEGVCIRGKKGDPCAVGWLERFVADWAAENMELEVPDVEPSGKKVAIVGAGPGGLTVAGELARMGHRVHVFEALHDTGGVLRYGIPEFRLPKHIIDHEVANLRKLGVEIECNVIIGRTLTIDELQRDFDAIFVANGAGLPMFLSIPGENLKGVYSANEYLTRVNLMGAWMTYEGVTPIARGETVVVFGGGNVAMDAVRTAKRLGAGRAVCAYRRTKAEMPARVEEITHAEQEGIEFEYLVAPLEILGDEQGWVRAVRLQRMELGEPDDSGRRRPVPVPGSEFELPCQIAIVALGTVANPLLTNATPGLELNRWGNIVTDEEHMTSMPCVFAGGDIVRGGATVILAMGDGKEAARSIDRSLRSGVCRRRGVTAEEVATAGSGAVTP